MEPMSEAMIRGYSIQRAAGFVREHYSEATCKVIESNYSEETRHLLVDMNPVTWYPRRHEVEILKAIVEVAGKENAYQELLACGRFICGEAINTFLRVALRIMSPVLFSKKLPSMWKRDQRGGTFEADLSRAADKQVVLTLSDVADYEHCGPLTAGFFSFMWNAMGFPKAMIAQHGWSYERPGPAEVVFEVRW
jgi:hypothetical protein